MKIVVRWSWSEKSIDVRFCESDTTDLWIRHHAMLDQIHKWREESEIFFHCCIGELLSNSRHAQLVNQHPYFSWISPQSTSASMHWKSRGESDTELTFLTVWTAWGVCFLSWSHCGCCMTPCRIHILFGVSTEKLGVNQGQYSQKTSICESDTVESPMLVFWWFY